MSCELISWINKEYLPAFQVTQLRHNSSTERALKQRVLDKISRPPLVVNCRNALITRFLEELSFIKQKRTAAGLEEVGEEEQEEELKEEEKPLVLQPPPLGRERSSSAPEEPASADPGTEEEKLVPAMARSTSLKVKKSVSFSPAPSFDEDQGTVSTSLGDVHGGKDKRKKWLLRKQETVEEQEGHNDKGLLDVDSGGDPFAHQRGTTMRPGKKVSAVRGGRRRFEKFRAVTSTVMSERKTSSTSVEVQSQVESTTSAVIESQGERFQMEVFETDDTLVETINDHTDSQASLTPPIARPESVAISLSPHSSPSKRPPVQDTDDQFPDILEAIKPLPPIPPVKFIPHLDEKHDPADTRNGSVAPESNLAADYDVERAQRLSRTRWWHKVYSNVEIISTDEDTQRIQRVEISVSDASETQRETNV